MKNRHIHRGLIYSITNIKTGHIYIGATGRSLERRLKDHKRYAANHNSPLARDIVFFGEDCFVIQHIATALHIDYLARLEASIIEQEHPYYNKAKPEQLSQWSQEPKLYKDGKNRFRERNRSAKASRIASDLIKL